ncbi:MAG: glycosyltransferase family 2 protein [Bryobacteraceae bacterium]|nr:glycosyltransferase family 2 protein [Bryobacteraceae bacterium]MDW8377749.1 glycosyltransferase family 2 protein [Bryobacterales bacterium]
MEVPIHAITLAGAGSPTLYHWIRHYQELGVDEIHVHLHIPEGQAAAREPLEADAQAAGCRIAAVHSGDWMAAAHAVYHESRQAFPNHWFVLADVDEFQEYPGGLRKVISECDRVGFDAIRGCFLDRLSRDGVLAPVEKHRPLSQQFPIGAFLTATILLGDPRKVVAVKGGRPVRRGQHHPIGGNPCPPRYYYLPVHHYKWVAGLEERLCARIDYLKKQGYMRWGESARFLQWLKHNGGRINLQEPALMAADSTNGYPHWARLVQKALDLPIPAVTS